MPTQIGGFGCVCDDGYGISYMVVGEDIGMYTSVRNGFGKKDLILVQFFAVNFSVHSKRSCPTTSTDEMCDAICKAFDDMKALFE